LRRSIGEKRLEYLRILSQAERAETAIVRFN
jgi:hypothetical protein